MARILAASDVYAASSRWEGLDIALGEAKLIWRPCAGTSISGHADALKYGVTGVAVPPEHPAALAEGIAWLLNNPAAAERMAALAYEFIMKGFSI